MARRFDEEDRRPGEDRGLVGRHPEVAAEFEPPLTRISPAPEPGR